MISTAPGRASSRSRMRRADARTSPFRTSAAIACGSVSAKHLPRDHHALHFVGALADLAQLAVPERALDGKLARIAVAAVDLDGDVAGAHPRPRRPPVGPRRPARGPALLILHPAGAADEQAGRLELGRRVGEHELDGLVVADGPP